MERVLAASSFPKPSLISHHAVKVSAWRTNQSLQPQQRRRLTLSSNSTPKTVSLFGADKNKPKQGENLNATDAAIKALEKAFGGKRSPLSRWVETQKREEDKGGNDNGGDDGGDGWSGGRGGSDGYKDEDKPEDVLQTIIAYLAFALMYFWMLFGEDMAKWYRAVRRWFRYYFYWEGFVECSLYYLELFKYNAEVFLFGREEDCYNLYPRQFYTLSEFFGALRLFWDRIFYDEEQQIKDCKEFESLLKDLLEYKRHRHN